MNLVLKKTLEKHYCVIIPCDTERTHAVVKSNVEKMVPHFFTIITTKPGDD